MMSGCKLPGKPGEEPEVPRPEQVVSFDALYGSNCAGCHGANGQNGMAMNLASPTYQALVDDATLKQIIMNGETGTLMPAFGLKRGGELTDQQVDALVKGMRARWSKDNVLAGQNVPPWKAGHAGDIANGQQVYAAACARCHGESAEKPGKDGSILDGSYLALVNEQTIRTVTIAGRSDLGMPDWRGLIKDRALTDSEVTDVAAWLMAQKPALPGQPYATPGQASKPMNGKPVENLEPAEKSKSAKKD
jgi:cytochrome c oxidase cbb3-type subunit 3/ubiquinol-cytochrome c reductase cytochrome c subunit